ncbi:hypothetical protein [Caldiplasma sukawensis]
MIISISLIILLMFSPALIHSGKFNNDRTVKNYSTTNYCFTVYEQGLPYNVDLIVIINNQAHYSNNSFLKISLPEGNYKVNIDTPPGYTDNFSEKSINLSKNINIYVGFTKINENAFPIITISIISSVITIILVLTYIFSYMRKK